MAEIIDKLPLHLSLITKTGMAILGSGLLVTVLCPQESELYRDRKFSIIYYSTLLVTLALGSEVTVLLFVCYCLAR